MYVMALVVYNKIGINFTWPWFMLVDCGSHMCPIQCVTSSQGSSYCQELQSSLVSSMVVYLSVNIVIIYTYFIECQTQKEKVMADKQDNTGKMEVAVRILGNELVALKMVVDDFKIKWLIYGVITIVALGWAASSFGPALFDMIGSNNG
jgi:hypothetical protein